MSFLDFQAEFGTLAEAKRWPQPSEPLQLIIFERLSKRGVKFGEHGNFWGLVAQAIEDSNVRSSSDFLTAINGYRQQEQQQVKAFLPPAATEPIDDPLRREAQIRAMRCHVWAALSQIDADTYPEVYAGDDFKTYTALGQKLHSLPIAPVEAELTPAPFGAFYALAGRLSHRNSRKNALLSIAPLVLSLLDRVGVPCPEFIAQPAATVPGSDDKPLGDTEIPKTENKAIAGDSGRGQAIALAFGAIPFPVGSRVQWDVSGCPEGLFEDLPGAVADEELVSGVEVGAIGVVVGYTIRDGWRVVRVEFDGKPAELPIEWVKGVDCE